METALTGFKTAFATHVRSVEKANMTKPPDQRSGKVRCSSKLIPPAASEYVFFIEKVMPELLFEKNAGSASITAEALGVQAGCISAASEKGWMASLRMAVTGTKTVMVCSARSAYALFGSKDPTSYWQDLMQIKDSDMARLEECGASMWSGTVGPKEVLYLPPGWIFAEKVMDKVDLVGFIVRGILKSIGNEVYDDMQLVRKLLHSCNKEDSDLGAAVQKMSSLLAAEGGKNQVNLHELAKMAEFEKSPNKKAKEDEESTKSQETTSWEGQVWTGAKLTSDMS